MNRFLVVLAALACTATLAQDFSKVGIRTIKITDNLYALAGAGGNLGVSVGDDAVFVIDDQFAPLSEKIAAAIAKISPKPVRFILNTHWHGDHTGGNENFAKGGAIIFAHENVRKRMSTDQFIEAIGAVDKVLALTTDKTRFIAGHGPAVSGRKDLQAYRDMLVTITTRVKGLLREGRKLEEIVAANVSAEFDDPWAKPYLNGPKFVEAVAKDLIRRAP